MDARDLQRLRRRVQRGERLSEAEVRRLRRLALSGIEADPRHTAPGKALEDAGAREHGGLRATWTDAAGSDDVLGHVLPVLAAVAAPGLLCREGPAGLAVTYLSDGVALDAQTAPASLEAVDRAAWEHLAARPSEPRPVIVDRGQPRLAPEALGLWALCEADGADGARLLTAGQRRRLLERVGAGPYRVSLVRAELALVAPLLEPSAVGPLESVTPGPGGIPGRFVLQPDGTLERLATG